MKCRAATLVGADGEAVKKLESSAIPLLASLLERYPQVVRWTRASGTTCGKGEVPSLAKEGWPRHQVNGPIPLKARPGWFVQLPIIGGLNQPHRLRPLRRLRGIFLMGAATPPCARRGLRLSLQLSSMPPCPAKDVGHSKAVVQGGVAERFRNIAKHLLIARPGWFSDESKRKTTPAASASVASPNFL